MFERSDITLNKDLIPANLTVLYKDHIICVGHLREHMFSPNASWEDQLIDSVHTTINGLCRDKRQLTFYNRDWLYFVSNIYLPTDRASGELKVWDVIDSSRLGLDFNTPRFSVPGGILAKNWMTAVGRSFIVSGPSSTIVIKAFCSNSDGYNCISSISNLLPGLEGTVEYCLNNGITEEVPSSESPLLAGIRSILGRVTTKYEAVVRITMDEHNIDSGKVTHHSLCAFFDSSPLEQYTLKFIVGQLSKPAILNRRSIFRLTKKEL